MRRPARRIGTGQLVIAEVTLVAVVVAAFLPRWVLLGVLALAGAILVATFGRADGRWWYEAVALRRRFNRRRRLAATRVVAAAVEGPPGPALLPWLRTLAPTLQVAPVQVGSATVGVAADDQGWFAVVEVGSLWGDDDLARLDDPGLASPWAPGARSSAPPAAVPYAELAALLRDAPDRAAVSAFEVVLVPGTGLDQPRPGWLAVRMTPVDALAGVGGIEAVRRAVAAAALRAARTLSGYGFPARAADAGGLVTALVEATGMVGAPQEHWAAWRSGGNVRTYLDLDGWRPAHGMLAAGITQLAVRFDRGRGEPAAVLAVLAAPAAVLGRVAREVVAAAAAQGVRAGRLDGEQAPAAWAAAPTAAAGSGRTASSVGRASLHDARR